MSENDSKKTTPPKSPSRRKFLKGAGVGAGVAVGAGVGVIPLEKSPLRAKYPVVAENKVELPPNGKSVVILGGGLSGLQAGVELSARGFKVTVLEKTGLPGGKLKSWRDKTFGPADDPQKKDPNFKGYVREHGIHAIWGFYNNLREFMHRYGWELQDTPAAEDLYLFMDKDGSRGQLLGNELPQPYGSLLQLLNVMQLDEYLNDEEQGRLRNFMRHAISFDHSDKAQRDYLDSITVAQWADSFDLPRVATDKILDSLIEMAFFDNAETASALSLACLLQSASGSPEDMRINLYMNPPGETFLQPMVDYIEAHGGKVIFNTELSRVEMGDGQVKSVVAGQIGDGKSPMTRCPVCGALLGPDGEHLEQCPMCGANGDMIRMLTEEEMAERHFSADYFISAMDIPATKRFFGGSLAALGGQDYFKRIQKLHSVHVYVVNLWYEGTDDWHRGVRLPSGKPGTDFFATGFEDLGITVNWAQPKSDGVPVVKDYEGMDVSVIETQVANAESVAHLDDKTLAERVHQELKVVMPGLPKYLDFYVNRWRNYTTYRPGDIANRPTVESPISNLLFVGDLTFVDHPSVFMERTNVTAKMATNALLDKIGQKQGRIRILPSGTPGLVRSVITRAGSVFPPKEA